MPPNALTWTNRSLLGWALTSYLGPLMRGVISPQHPTYSPVGGVSGEEPLVAKFITATPISARRACIFKIRQDGFFCCFQESARTAFPAVFKNPLGLLFRNFPPKTRLSYRQAPFRCHRRHFGAIGAIVINTRIR